MVKNLITKSEKIFSIKHNNAIINIEFIFQPI